MATWYAVCDGGGNLVSTGTSVADAATLAAAGLTAVQLTGDPTGQVWDNARRNFVAPAPAAKSSVLPVLDFVKRFQPTEYQAIRASTDPQVAMFLLEIDFAPGGTIDLASADVVNGLAYLARVGILSASRQTTIGTP